MYIYLLSTDITNNNNDEGGRGTLIASRLEFIVT